MLPRSPGSASVKGLDPGVKEGLRRRRNGSRWNNGKRRRKWKINVNKRD